MIGLTRIRPGFIRPSGHIVLVDSLELYEVIEERLLGSSRIRSVTVSSKEHTPWNRIHYGKVLFPFETVYQQVNMQISEICILFPRICAQIVHRGKSSGRSREELGWSP